jgi:hypothetical protein
MFKQVLIKKLFFLIILILHSAILLGQTSGEKFYDGELINSVQIEFKNTPADSMLTKSMEAKVRNTFRVFPQTSTRILILDYYLAKVKQLPEVSNASYEIRPASTGGIDIILTVTLQAKPTMKDGKSGVFAGDKDFPLLYQDNKTLFTTKISGAPMLYTNNNAWYGKPDEMLAGNPLVHHPAGKGFTGWLEGWASAGLYGITTLSSRKNIYVYGGASYIVSGSAGRELFTNKSRIYGAFDDAYLGVFGILGAKSKHDFLYNLSAGRQQFTIGQGFIIRSTAGNGDNRGALQLNPRWAADNVYLASFRYRHMRLQVFQLDPDELEIIDSKTVIQGINAELGDGKSNLLGLTFLQVPKSNFKYYTPSGEILSRKGLQVYNFRFYGTSLPGIPGLFYKMELGYERNTHFNMGAYAGYAEAGWNFTSAKISPTISYRFSYFSGDNPDTKKYERWDALLSGGNGEQFVLGANHFKVVQNSNVIVHRVQANLHPTQKTELVPQFLYFYAAQKNNIGGNPTLSTLANKEYGYEANITAKYFLSRRWYIHGHIAYTIPGKSIQDALNHEARNWLSIMGFVVFSL